ncbi:alpha-hydroxy acid oxidase [Streptomyces tsukubensis]|uniref:Alpha-hydroxy-acid oxidizing enzyme n=1 Tax=Streptomyces tsukubensis TaxID=83656 RepID=A0A1V4A2A5_9ACTN|nr:alpha-hydroxy acid oxidase [Streptomyces tsukubensis]OON73485.1 alpha-hydroxy-acid oxidizing enzyme [Streptomyces tsukubensis]QFR96724.1 alpha-hydroxy-acid oxidizing protein [Streptomyces tsukubensis]
MPPDVPPPVCVADVERSAARRLPREVHDFVAGGSGDESAMRANRDALDRVRVVPRILAGSDSPDTATALLGVEASMPVAVAPMAYQRLLHPQAERAAARAARAAGVPYVISTLSSDPLEEVAEAGGTTWFQLYWLRDRARVTELVRRAEEAGCRALVLTVDVPVMGRRLRDVRNGFALPSTVTAANLGTGTDGVPHIARAGVSAVAAHTGLAFEAAIGWSDLAWLRALTALPLVLKGVLDPRDAHQAVESGVDGVIVSNHGGRQLSSAPASVTALPGVVEAVGGRCSVLFDSGIRSGTDILRALALGADGVLCGRPVLWGLATDGEAGVGLVLGLLRTELTEALQLSGCGDVAAARALATVVG